MTDTETNHLRIENAELHAAVETLESRLFGAESANRALGETLVEHTELNGHIEIVEQCRDYLDHQAMDVGDPTGRLRDFAASLRIVIDQLDRQRRQRNWYEVAYTAGKQKLIESAIRKTFDRARDAAVRFVSHVENLGAFADDNDPRVMATAGPIGEAQCDLYAALGLDLDKEAARQREDAANRCAVCGWTLAATVAEGCVRGNCSLRPRPTNLYAPERAAKEASGE